MSDWICGENYDHDYLVRYEDDLRIYNCIECGAEWIEEDNQ